MKTLASSLVALGFVGVFNSPALAACEGELADPEVYPVMQQATDQVINAKTGPGSIRDVFGRLSTVIDEALHPEVYQRGENVKIPWEMRGQILALIVNGLRPGHAHAPRNGECR